jgi:hypothetical protein
MHRFFAFVIYLILLSGCRADPPTQVELDNQFSANHASYEALKDMVLEDKIVAVTANGTEFSRSPYTFEAPQVIGISAPRAKKYQVLMGAADVQRIDVTEDGHVVISMASWGIANRGWRVSAVWRETPVENLLPTLDAFKKRSSKWQTGYSKAGENWYFRIIW